MTTFKTRYNRRSFLKVSAAAGGGLMISYNGLISCQPAKEERQPPKEWFDFQNGYVKVGDNGQVTILSPNPEIGQNVKTSMPMIVAEELEVAWEDVIVEQAALNTNWYDRQVAGGSQSIRQEWESLRMAGATAKQMLVMAAAQQWEVEPSTCTGSQEVRGSTPLSSTRVSVNLSRKFTKSGKRKWQKVAKNLPLFSFYKTSIF